MSVKLIVHPKDKPMTWRDFCESTEPFSIALDGYVAEEPRFDPKGPRINFNHHEGVDRSATRATCGQVLLAIRQGLFLCFQQNGEPHANVYVDDCDQDVCLSWFLLNNSEVVENITRNRLNALVNMEDILDTTAGAHPFPPHLPILEKLTWIFAPYYDFRLSGKLDKRDSGEFEDVIFSVEKRILRYLHGTGRSLKLDTRYKKIGGNGTWTMVEEMGAQARTGMFADGIRAYVTVRERPNGKYTYTIGRMSQFVPFDVGAIAKALNRAENIKDGGWGGGNTIIGSPRATGSSLKPKQVEEIINKTIKC